MARAEDAVLSWQREFYPAWHARWAGLHSADLRALVWLVEAPALLDQQAACWQNKLAQYADLALPAVDWLAWQDDAKILAELAGMTQARRLGRYAEKLLAWYFARQHCLFAAGLQVQIPASADAPVKTLGEFDFLLQVQDALWHWELATKFYLYAPHLSTRHSSDYFIGPNLADSLGAKMQKILHRQLALGEHASLPQPLAQARAYIRGWLFYPWDSQLPQSAHKPETGLAAQHCRGFWCQRAALPALAQALACAHLSLLPRLQWLAPLQQVGVPTELLIDDSAASPPGESNGIHSLAAWLAWLPTYFAKQTMPLMLVFMQPANSVAEKTPGVWLECGRVFVVPDDWQQRAASMPVRG